MTDDSVVARTLSGVTDLWQVSIRYIAQAREASRRQIVGGSSDEAHDLEWWRREDVID